MPTEAILSTVRQFLGVDPTVRITLEPIKRGASGRTIVRVKTPGHEPFIGVHWTEEREDNSQFIPVAQFLKQAKLRVPAIIHDRARYRVALVEDLGDVDLLSLKDRPFAERLPLYRSAFEQVDKLFYAKPAKEFHLMPPFDAALYRWEQEYFFEYMVEDFLDLYGEAAALRKNEAFVELSQRLGTVARHLVHRDFQSQNLHDQGRPGLAHRLPRPPPRPPGIRSRVAHFRSLSGPLRRGAGAASHAVGGNRRRAPAGNPLPRMRRATPDAGARSVRKHREKPWRRVVSPAHRDGRAACSAR